MGTLCYNQDKAKGDTMESLMVTDQKGRVPQTRTSDYTNWKSSYFINQKEGDLVDQFSKLWEYKDNQESKFEKS